MATVEKALALIASPRPAADSRQEIINEAVHYWREHVNPGFLDYRKSVSTDYTAVEWCDEGALVRDLGGREFIDLLGGFGVYSVGHRHPRVLKAVREQLDKQAIHSQELIDPLRCYLAKIVAEITPGDLCYSFFSNSGTEAVEGCLKMAILATGRHHFIGALGGFHGKSLGSLGGTSKATFREPFMPLMHWSHVPFGDCAALEMVLHSGEFTGNRVAAVVLEPIQGEGGINVAPPGYLATARALCNRYGAMLVFDEIQCGMGRTGKMFYCEHDEVVPDLMALGKGFGGGVMPIGAVVGTAKVWERYIDNPFLHTTTFGGNPLACAAAIATVGVLLEENLLTQAYEKGLFLLEKLRVMKEKYPRLMVDVRGCGLMLGMEFVDHLSGYAVATELFSRNILISGTYINAKCLRIEPPLVITMEQLASFLERLDASLAAVEKVKR
jgi:putrescine aminotransferase